MVPPESQIVEDVVVWLSLFFVIPAGMTGHVEVTMVSPGESRAPSGALQLIS